MESFVIVYNKTIFGLSFRDVLINQALCKCRKRYLYLWIYLMMAGMNEIRPHDHKLRKFLSLKLDFEYLKFYWTH